MKGLITLLFTVFLFAGTTVFAQTQEEENPFEGIEFEQETVDFGVAKLNEPATVTFHFKNTGKKPVIIKAAQPSCGCTTPDWTKEPILPGKEGEIKATYNSAALGKTHKTVFVNFQGIPQAKELYLKGTVEK